jgi:hypothetical protein
MRTPKVLDRHAESCKEVADKSNEIKPRWIESAFTQGLMESGLALGKRTLARQYCKEMDRNPTQNIPILYRTRGKKKQDVVTPTLRSGRYSHSKYQRQNKYLTPNDPRPIPPARCKMTGKLRTAEPSLTDYSHVPGGGRSQGRC